MGEATVTYVSRAYIAGEIQAETAPCRKAKAMRRALKKPSIMPWQKVRFLRVCACVFSRRPCAGERIKIEYDFTPSARPRKPRNDLFTSTSGGDFKSGAANSSLLARMGNECVLSRPGTRCCADTLHTAQLPRLVLAVTYNTHRPLVVKLDEEESSVEVTIRREVAAREVPDGIAAHRAAEGPADARAVVVQSLLKIWIASWKPS